MASRPPPAWCWGPRRQARKRGSRSCRSPRSPSAGRVAACRPRLRPPLPPASCRPHCGPLARRSGRSWYETEWSSRQLRRRHSAAHVPDRPWPVRSLAHNIQAVWYEPRPSWLCSCSAEIPLECVAIRMDIAVWLRGLSLEQYEPAFRDNEIDWEVLPKLTSEDLREIGVVAIGHRRKLLAAIAVLGSETPAPAMAPPARADAERRQLTVMFCDLVGSTALSSQLDPEDLREVIAAYHRTVTEVIAGFDGFVAKYMGDGVLVYFGYPVAHEDDAERAVRAGLGLIDIVGRLDVKSVQLHTRVGIATGLVVVGDLIGEGSAQEQSVVGETPNLAARLQA